MDRKARIEERRRRKAEQESSPVKKEASPNNKKQKSVQEIDGALYFVDEKGSPIKKVRRKEKSCPQEEATKPASEEFSHDRKIKKKNVAEIDGQLYLLDDQGNTVKKIRKKNSSQSSQQSAEFTKKPVRRAKSAGWLEDNIFGRRKGEQSVLRGKEDRRRNRDSTGRRRRSKSVSRDEEEQPGQDRGRRGLAPGNRQRSRSLSRKEEEKDTDSNTKKQTRGQERGRKGLLLGHTRRSKSLGRQEGGDRNDSNAKKQSRGQEQERRLFSPRSRRRSRSLGRQEAEKPRGQERERLRLSLGNRRRSRSLGRQEAEKPNDASTKVQPREYVDEKGRKVVITEDGTKTITDKNGKRLRKKKKVSPDPSKDDDEISVGIGGQSLLADSFQTSNMFDKLWDDESRKPDTASASPQREVATDHKNVKATDSAFNGSLSEKISQYGKENRELQLKLMNAEETMRNLGELNKKEKSKNVKASTDMMQLKADFHESNSELQSLRTKMADLRATMQMKDREILALRTKSQAQEAQSATTESALKGRHHDTIEDEKKNERQDEVGGAPRCASCGAENQEVQDLFGENRALQRKLEFEKQTSRNEMDKKDKKIDSLSNELTSLRQELEMVIKGEKGDGKTDPSLVRLVNEKRVIEEKFEQEKEATSTRIAGLEKAIESLQSMNDKLKKRLKLAGQEDFGSDDDSLDLNQAIMPPGMDHRDGSNKGPESNASISNMWNSFIGRS